MVKYILLHVPEEPRFTDAQLQTLVDILVGSGLVGFGSVAIPAVLEKGSMLMFSAGLVLACFCGILESEYRGGLKHE